MEDVREGQRERGREGGRWRKRGGEGGREGGGKRRRERRREGGEGSGGKGRKSHVFSSTTVSLLALVVLPSLTPSSLPFLSPPPPPPPPSLRLYSDPKQRPRSNLLFVLSGGGKLNYFGTKSLLEEEGEDKGQPLRGFPYMYLYIRIRVHVPSYTYVLAFSFSYMLS